MKKLFKTLLIGAGVATAIAPQVAKSNHTQAVVERQIINEIRPTHKYSITNHIGGLPLVTEFYGNPIGLTPKEYGILFGNGKSRKHRSNRILMSKRTKFKHK